MDGTTPANFNRFLFKLSHSSGGKNLQNRKSLLVGTFLASFNPFAIKLHFSPISILLFQYFIFNNYLFHFCLKYSHSKNATIHSPSWFSPSNPNRKEVNIWRRLLIGEQIGCQTIATIQSATQFTGNDRRQQWRLLGWKRIH